MVFNSLQYAIFVPVVLAAYWSLRHRGQNALLLVASYLFYSAWDYRFCGLMVLSTMVDYAVGRLLAVTGDERRRKLVFAISLAVNLGVLGFFKYFDFFVDSAAELLGAFGFNPDPPTLEILLPVGISFYTFHGISYTFDVYRREIEPARDLLSFAVFVAFFPQLVAGPIGRAHLQLPQFEHPRTPPAAGQVRSGLFLILLGLFKKVAIADALAPYVNQIFSGADARGSVDLVVGAYAFALQIYGDFSGYSDIARGSARLLGIELPVNFTQPYLSRKITEFWRTWHISLSSWLRDYLYVPLGGNRGSRPRVYRNLMITMLIGGLWHGAAWTFVIWGALHGFLLAAERARGVHSPRCPGPVTRGDAVRIFATFNLVCLAWVFFRAETLDQALSYLAGIVSLRSGGIDGSALLLVLLAGLAVLVLDVVQRNRNDDTAPLRWPAPARGALYGGLTTAVVLFSGEQPVPFIYFQF